jgi:hypothetical protein
MRDDGDEAEGHCSTSRKMESSFNFLYSRAIKLCEDPSTATITTISNVDTTAGRRSVSSSGRESLGE